MNGTSRLTLPLWLTYLNPEDLSFVRNFILASGSLKDLAHTYGISYPTVRLRLDRLITKIQLVENHDISNGFERILRLKFAEGCFDLDTLKVLLEAHRQELDSTDS